ncbi:MAG: SAM-dependent methyltransferase [Williamsia sp.]|nr:SAM-dependent methyltransferase [Williamsia sp.]
MASAALGRVYLLPAYLDEEALLSIPAYVLDGVKGCQAFFVENERSARRYLKLLWKEINIDSYEWHAIHKAEEEVKETFKKLLQRGMTIGIISEAGCPGVADPGQLLVATAQEMGAQVKPFVGPSSLLLALMASGMNGQQFRFNGYLPIDTAERIKTLKEIETESQRKNCTQLFIETPYRNNQLLETICKTCQPSTRLCIAVDITGSQETIQTKTIAQWKTAGLPDIHKRPAIFLLHAAKLFLKMGM